MIHIIVCIVKAIYILFTRHLFTYCLYLHIIYCYHSRFDITTDVLCSAKPFTKKVQPLLAQGKEFTFLWPLLWFRGRSFIHRPLSYLHLFYFPYLLPQTRLKWITPLTLDSMFFGDMKPGGRRTPNGHPLLARHRPT